MVIVVPKALLDPSKLTALARVPFTDQSAAWKEPITGSLVVTTIDVAVFVTAELKVGTALSIATAVEEPLPGLPAASFTFTVRVTVPAGRPPEFRATVPPRAPLFTVQDGVTSGFSAEGPPRMVSLQDVMAAV